MLLVTVPTAAASLGAPVWLVRRLADQLCTPARYGRFRLLTPDDVERIRQALAARAARASTGPAHPEVPCAT
jgi:hypothetical protein